MKVQVIDKKKFLFRVDNREYMFSRPHSLLCGLKLIEAKVKGSTIGWNIEGGFLSYNQLRKALKK